MGSKLEHGVVQPDPGLKAHAKNLYPSLEEITLAAEQATALMMSDGYEVLRHLIGAELAEIDAKLDSRQVLDHTEYAAYHGRRAGLRTVEGLLISLISCAETQLAEQRAKHEVGAESPARG